MLPIAPNAQDHILSLLPGSTGTVSALEDTMMTSLIHRNASSAYKMPARSAILPCYARSV